MNGRREPAAARRLEVQLSILIMRNYDISKILLLNYHTFLRRRQNSAEMRC
jgi:hypothetical protein